MRIRAKYVALYSPGTPQQIAERYRAQYCKPDGSWDSTIYGPSNAKYELLLTAKTLDDCDATIGNSSWTHFVCDGCGDQTRTAVLIGECLMKGYCATCLAEAQSLLAVEA